MQAAQLGTGLDADCVDERVARPPVRAEGVGLPATAVQRQHPQAVEALAQRLLRDQRLQLAHRLGVARLEVLHDGHLDRLHA